MSFETKDSGRREEHPSGMRRNVQTGKADGLLAAAARGRAVRGSDAHPLCGTDARGAEKYGRRNWQFASSEEELDRFKASAFRRFVQWITGESDEDHAAAVFFDITAAEYVKRRGRIVDGSY